MSMYSPTSAYPYDYEPPDPPKSPNPYSRAMAGAYRKGCEAARTFDKYNNPYVREDFAMAWDLGYETTAENMTAAIVGALVPNGVECPHCKSDVTAHIDDIWEDEYLVCSIHQCYSCAQTFETVDHKDNQS